MGAQGLRALLVSQRWYIAAPMGGKLYIIAAPIGNPKDITDRAKEMLGQLTFLACEDTRTAKRQLQTWQIPCEHKRFISLFEHNERQRVSLLLDVLRQGQDVGLLVSRGTPMISDPGYILTREAIEAGMEIKALPGPSACISALLVSGLPSDKFLFLGFPPRKEGQQRRFFEKYKDLDLTLIFYESPRRVLKTLTRLEPVFSNWNMAVCRELNKPYEEIIRGRLSDVLNHIKDKKILGEITVVLAKK